MMQQAPKHFANDRRLDEPAPAFNEVTINRADTGDANVVLSLPYQPAAIVLKPDIARLFALDILRAADIIEGK